MINLSAINSGWILFVQDREAFDHLVLCHDLSVHHDTEVDRQISRIVRVNG